MISDIRYALRSILHHRSFAAVAILSIALAVGANSVIFSLGDALLFRSMPVPDAGRVMNVSWQLRGQSPSGMSYPDFTDFRDRSKAFQGLGAYQLSQFGFAFNKHELPQMKAGLLVTGNLLNVLRVTPQLGRGFRPEEDSPSASDAVVIISDDTWRNDFNAKPDVIGRSVFVNGTEFKIIGVTPGKFTGVDQFFRPALYMPLHMSRRIAGNTGPDWTEKRDDRRLTVKGRLKDGVSQASANAEASVIASGLQKAYPATNRDWSATIRTDMQARIDMSPYDAIVVALLLGLAGVVLLIACANVANLMLGRALARSGEIAIRMAIGAGRWRVVRQLLTESVLISLFAGAAGLVLAQTCLDLLLPWRIPSSIPIEISARLDYRVMLYALCASLASAVFCGLLPAIRATRHNIEPALRAGGRNLEPRGRFLGRNVLVVVQVAGSLFLLICASQMYRGISYLLAAPPGFRQDHILMASFDPALARYSDAQADVFYKRLTERARQMPAVVSASLAELVPMASMPDIRLIVPEGYRLPPGKDALTIGANVVSEDYFSTVDIPIVKGRAFRASDTGDSPRVAVANEHFAKSYFGNQDPIGKRFRLGGPEGPWVEIVGVAKTSKYMMLVEPPLSFVYLPFSQNRRTEMTLLVQSAGPADSLAAPLRDLVRGLDSDQPVFAVRTMEEYFQDRAVKVVTIFTGIVGGMGLLGLILALSGLYAVMAFSVTRRRREIGIRMAVGADSVAVLGMVLRQGLRLSLMGIAIGLALSLPFGKVLSSGIGLPSFSVPVLVLVSLALLVMTVLGSYLPARRASLVDPITVLRQE